MTNKRNSSFGDRGTFACGVCERMTRQVRGLGNDNCCPQCFELAGLENSISDGAMTPEECQIEARALWADAVKKGGDDASMRREFSQELVALI